MEVSEPVTRVLETSWKLRWIVCSSATKQSPYTIREKHWLSDQAITLHNPRKTLTQWPSNHPTQSEKNTDLATKQSPYTIREKHWLSDQAITLHNQRPSNHPTQSEKNTDSVTKQSPYTIREKHPTQSSSTTNTTFQHPLYFRKYTDILTVFKPCTRQEIQGNAVTSIHSNTPHNTGITKKFSSEL